MTKQCLCQKAFQRGLYGWLFDYKCVSIGEAEDYLQFLVGVETDNLSILFIISMDNFKTTVGILMDELILFFGYGKAKAGHLIG